jgi:hypothetical protein
LSGAQSLRILVQRGVAHMVQGLDVPVTAGGGGDDLRGAAACAAAAGDAEGGDGGAQVPVMGVADGALDEERLRGVVCTATVLEDDLPGLMPFSVRMPDLS